MIERRVAGESRHPLVPGSEHWWRRLVAVPGQTVPVITVATVSKVIVAGRGILWGGALIESAGVALRFQLLDGTDANGSFCFEANLAGNAFVGVNTSQAGLRIERGLYFQVVSGNGLLHGSLIFTRGDLLPGDL